MRSTLRPLVTLLAIGLLALHPRTARAQLPPPQTFSAVGDGVASSIAAFKAALGPSRQVTWDDVPDQYAAPNAFPEAFYQAQGLDVWEQGVGGGLYLDPPVYSIVQVSGTPPLLGNQHPDFPALFTAYSGDRIFRPYTTAVLGSSVEVQFVIPGTTTRATVSGFGAVFTDVNLEGVTKMEFFDVDNGSIGVYDVPAASGHKTVSFLGVLLPGRHISLVRLTVGTTRASNTVLEDATHDIVAMDDYVYSEPVAFAQPSITLTSPTTQTEFTATGPFLTIGGRKERAGQVSWSNDRGGSGLLPAFGTTWAIPDIPIAPGPNTIIVAAAGAPALVLHVNGGPFVYSFAEGSTGGFFDTDISIANPNATPAPVTIQFLREDGGRVEFTDVIGAMQRKTIHVDDVKGVEATAFSTVVTSTDRVPLVVERTMFWDRTAYGGKAATAIDASETWLFAEGVQNSFFNTFVLLENPGTEDATATLTFELAFGEQPVVKQVPLPPLSRVTVDTGFIPPLVGRSFGLSIQASRPIVAERATYFETTPVQLWSGGHGSPGVTAPSPFWYFSEGATGPFRETFLLLSNPTDTPAMPIVEFSGGTLPGIATQPRMAPHSRVTIPIKDVNQGFPDRLDNTELAFRISSSVPIVAERAMYWLGPPGPWADGTSTFGTRTTGQRWGYAEGRSGGALNFHTYIRIFNPSWLPTMVADVNVTFFTTSGRTVVRTYTVPPFVSGEATTTPYAFITIDTATIPELTGESFGTLIECTNGIDISTERSTYWDANGVFWAAGLATAGTRLP